MPGASQWSDSGELLALLTFNIAYDTGIFAQERHRIHLSGCYLTLAYTGCRPAEIVDNERKKPKDGSWEALFDPKSLGVPSLSSLRAAKSDMPPGEHDKLLERLLLQETLSRGRPKALCWEDILMMVRDPVTNRDVIAMGIKFAHHKGADNKPKP